jgi:hypothetical protein
LQGIVLHEAYDPDAFVDLLDAHTLTGQHGRDIDAFAAHADAAAGSHQHVAIDWRFAGGRAERLRGLAAELVGDENATARSDHLPKTPAL